MQKIVRIFCMLGLLSSCGIADSVSISANSGGTSSTGGSGATCNGTPTPGTNLYFFMVINQVLTGNLGGRNGADALCRSVYDANYSSLGCSKVFALISISDSDEIRDLPTNCGFSGTTPVRSAVFPANTLSATFNQMISGPGLTWGGWGVPRAPYTGSDSFGALVAGQHCNGFTSSANTPVMLATDSQATDETYITGGASTCNAGNDSVYCLCI